jgi:serine/threonine protein kinase
VEKLDQISALRQVESCMKAIHALGVLHRDVMPRNILWDCDSDEATVIDFERARIGPARPILGPLSTNRKRKQKNDSSDQKRTDCAERPFA